MKRIYKYHREKMAIKKLIWTLAERIEVNKLDAMITEEMARLKNWLLPLKQEGV